MMHRVQQGIEHWKAGRLTEAAEQIKSFLQAFPQHPTGLANLANVLRDQGEIEQALRLYWQALESADAIDGIQPDAEWIWSNYLLTLNYSDTVGMETLIQSHRQWASRFPVPSDVPWRNRRTGDRRFHLGFVSGDLRWHSVAFFLLSLMRHLDRATFEVTCFSDNLSDDDMTGILRGFADAWVPCRDLDDISLMQSIRRSRVDILIDLSGHTAYNRMGVFAMRAAPIQVSWLGYPTPSGNPCIDYWLTDPGICSIGAASSVASGWMGSRPIHLLPSVHAYHPALPAEEMPPTRWVESETTERETIWLGCFNHRAKVSTETLYMWAKILQRFPQTKLLLKSRSYADAGVCDSIRQSLVSRGIESGRVVFLPRTASTREHLHCYRRIDLALDTFPYNGTTTTCESLWMGVPVVTRKGESHASSVSSSLLHQLGKQAWIAHSREAYVTAAGNLIEDAEQRREFRENSRDLMFRCGLTDGNRFAACWSEAMLKLWRDWIRRE